MMLMALFLIAAVGNIVAVLACFRAMAWYEARTGKPGMGWPIGALTYAACVAVTIGLLSILVLRFGRGLMA